MDCECDGGGNRYLSNVDLKRSPALARLFPGRAEIPSGVCSLQLKPDESPWIVCPRRLLVLGRANAGTRQYQNYAESLLVRHAGYDAGTKVGIWPEVKMKHHDNARKKSFDYTFDYILMPIGRASSSYVEEATGKRWGQLKSLIQKAGYTLSLGRDGHYVEDFPMGNPSIVEIMTSSTSGGNKRKRTTIPMAFEDAMLGKMHEGPGINYRQVWARMVSQLIVKSEVGLSWGGKAFWVLQDSLSDYITTSTALDFGNFVATTASEVNVISLSYGDQRKNASGILELNVGEFYAGPISSSGQTAQPCFQDMIRAPACPPKELLLTLLSKKKHVNSITCH